MGLLGSISTSLVGADGGETFTYHCASCEAEFELPKNRMVGVNCPDCRSMDVRAVVEN